MTDSAEWCCGHISWQYGALLVLTGTPALGILCPAHSILGAPAVGTSSGPPALTATRLWFVLPRQTLLHTGKSASTVESKVWLKARLMPLCPVLSQGADWQTAAGSSSITLNNRSWHGTISPCLFLGKDNFFKIL